MRIWKYFSDILLKCPENESQEIIDKDNCNSTEKIIDENLIGPEKESEITLPQVFEVDSNEKTSIKIDQNENTNEEELKKRKVVESDSDEAPEEVTVLKLWNTCKQLSESLWFVKIHITSSDFIQTVSSEKKKVAIE